MKTLSLKLPDELDAKLTSAAKESWTTKSEVIRRALETYLSDEGRSRPGSFLELSQDLIGSLEGPGDLSYNKERMREYGK